MRFKVFSALCLLFAVVFGAACGPAMADDPVKVPTAWMDEHESFVMWYAKQKGMDAAAGLDIQLNFFNSGKDICAAQGNGSWVFAGMSGAAAMMGSLEKDILIVGMANDASLTCSVLVHKDSPILEHKGENPLFPDVAGSADLVRGKTFLTSAQSGAHYALAAWLDTMGLTLNDVIVKDMDQSQALIAFENNLGDGIALRSPHLYVGAGKKWHVVSTLKKCDIVSPTVLVADKAYAEENPEVVSKFLSVYLKVVDIFQTEDPQDLAADYVRFFLEWAGKGYTTEHAVYDLQSHPVYDLKDQLKVFDTAEGPSSMMQWETKTAEFFASHGLITEEQLEKARACEFISDAYLKALAEAD